MCFSFKTIPEALIPLSGGGSRFGDCLGEEIHLKVGMHKSDVYNDIWNFFEMETNNLIAW